MMGKELETAVVMKAGTRGGCCGCARMSSGLSPHRRSSWGKAGPANQPRLHWETSRSMPWAPHCLVWFFVSSWGFSLLCERRSRKQKARPLLKLAYSNTLGQTLDTHAGEAPSTGPGADSTRGSEMLPAWSQLPFRRATAPHPVVPTPSPLLSLPKEICILSFIIFF